MSVVSNGHDDAGFTLVEILVVVAIIGLAAALVVPSLGRLVQAVRRDGERQDAVDQVAQLSFSAYSKGAPFTLTNDTRDVLKLPDGWSYTVERPIRFNAMGLCDGGRLDLLPGDDAPLRLRLAAPDCAVTIER